MCVGLLQRNTATQHLTRHTTATHYCNTLLQHNPPTHTSKNICICCLVLLFSQPLYKSSTATHCCNTLLQHTTAPMPAYADFFRVTAGYVTKKTSVQHTAATHYGNTLLQRTIATLPAYAVFFRSTACHLMNPPVPPWKTEFSKMNSHNIMSLFNLLHTKNIKFAF